jgi:hypothetical protein
LNGEIYEREKERKKMGGRRGCKRNDSALNSSGFSLNQYKL